MPLGLYARSFLITKRVGEDHVWARSSSVGTAGSVSVETMTRYLTECQGKEQSERGSLSSHPLARGGTSRSYVKKTHPTGQASVPAARNRTTGNSSSWITPPTRDFMVKALDIANLYFFITENKVLVIQNNGTRQLKSMSSGCCGSCYDAQCSRLTNKNAFRATTHRRNIKKIGHMPHVSVYACYVYYSYSEACRGINIRKIALTMQQTKMSKLYGLILLGAAVLLCVLLAISMITALFFPAESGMQPSWIAYLSLVIPVGIAVICVYQLRTTRETPLFSQRLSIPLGLSLGILVAILFYIPGIGMLVLWSSIGPEMLIGLIGLALINQNSIDSISPIFALVSITYNAVFVICYSISAYQTTRHSGSLKKGMWSCLIAIIATYLATTLTSTFINVIVYFIFHKRSELFSPSTIAGFSPLLNYMASAYSYMTTTAVVLIAPAVLGLLIALLISRRLTAIR